MQTTLQKNFITSQKFNNPSKNKDKIFTCTFFFYYYLMFYYSSKPFNNITLKEINYINKANLIFNIYMYMA